MLMKVHLLGTSGALASARRGNTSLAAATGRTTLLIECSGNPGHQLLRAGLDLYGLEHVLISHLHTDHLYGLPSLIHQIYIGNLPVGRGPLTIWGPESALKTAERLLEALGLRRRRNLFEIRLSPLPREVHTMTLGDLEVTTFPVDHGSVPALGVRVEPAGEPGRSVVYSSDTGPCAGVVEQSREAAWLLHECSFVSGEGMRGHTSLGQLGDLLRETPVPRVVLVHLPPMTTGEEARVGDELRRDHGERVVLGEDGMVVEVG